MPQSGGRSSITGLESTPRPSTSTSTRSPARNRTGGSRVNPTPGLQRVPVHPRLDPERLQVVDLSAENERGPGRRERVDRLAGRPLAGTHLEVARRDVDKWHSPGDVIQGLRHAHRTGTADR